MPKEVFGREYAYLPPSLLLSFEEIARLTRIFAGHGVEKVRLTGGEPLLRHEIDRLVRMLAEIPGIRDLTLTTNGSLLASKAQALRDAGLHRISISLDSLDDGVFRAMNDVDFPVARVLKGIDVALAAGFSPIKINMVVRRGLNDDSILPMARFFRRSGTILRFIEYMDVGTSNGWRLDDVVPAAEIVRIINEDSPLEPADSHYRGEVAKRYRYRDGVGEIGVVSSVTQPFCADCSRVRLSSVGSLYTCLFAAAGQDLRSPLRSGATDALLSEIIGRVWRVRDDRYSEIRTASTSAREKVEMSRIGG
jgi:cyclic pyranopterin phosphate synthase